MTARLQRQLIGKLKSLTWPTQNPAIDGFTAPKANRFPLDSLFVIGRNIYQSAVGSSNSAKAYIKDFMAKTQGIDPTKRKALLDGMLFEIFFDSTGAVRSGSRTYFSPMCSRSSSSKSSPRASTSSLSACCPDAARFYALPGKTPDVVVDVTTTRESDDDYIVEAIHCGGASILSERRNRIHLRPTRANRSSTGK